MENTKETKKQKQQFFGTLVGEMWKVPKNKNKHNSSGLLPFSTFHLQESHFFFFFFGIFHFSPAKVPKYWVLLLLLLLLLFFCIFHISPPSVPQCQESHFLYFPHLLCRFSGSKSPEHFVFACILLLSVSDFPKDSEFRLPKRRCVNSLNWYLKNFSAFVYTYTHITCP